MKPLSDPQTAALKYPCRTRAEAMRPQLSWLVGVNKINMILIANCGYEIIDSPFQVPVWEVMIQNHPEFTFGEQKQMAEQALDGVGSNSSGSASSHGSVSMTHRRAMNDDELDILGLQVDPHGDPYSELGDIRSWTQDERLVLRTHLISGLAFQQRLQVKTWFNQELLAMPAVNGRPL